MKLLIGLLALASGPAAAAGVHPPEVEARLAKIIGDWTLAGHEATYRERCDWYHGRAFVVCASEDRSDKSHSQSVIGYSAADGHYTYHNYDSKGASNSRTGHPHGERGLVYTAERRTREGLVRTTTWVTPHPDGRVHFREQRSLAGGPWAEAADFHYVRRSAGAPR